VRPEGLGKVKISPHADENKEYPTNGIAVVELA
jgi:hypothetical protein